MGFALAPLVLYLALVPPVSGDKDGSEFTLALATSGIPHPTGYPIYTLAGHGFARLIHAFGATWPYAANAWSAVGAAVALFFFHATAVRLLPGGPVPRALVAGACTLLLALHPVFTMEATLAEVYSWHLAWLMGLILLFVSWMTRLNHEPRPSSGWSRRAALWGVACGLGLAHHFTSVLFALPVSLALALALARTGHWRARLVLVAVAGAALPLAAYGYLVFRAFHPAAWQWPLLDGSFAGILRHVTGVDYQRYLGRFAPNVVQARWLALYVYPLLVVGLSTLAIGAARARDAGGRWIRVTLLAGASLQLVHAFNYGVTDPASYFLPPLAISLLGVLGLASWLAAQGRTAVALGAVVAVTLVAGVSWIPLAVERRALLGAFEGNIRTMWRAIPVDDAFVFWADDLSMRLHEYQLLAGERPHLDVENPHAFTYPEPRRRFAQRHGFDPLAGLDPITREKLARIPENVSRQTSRPVVVFDHLSGSVRVVPKAESHELSR
ncbi:MAG TPA: DUF2723 domain-containing protein [Candidatus Limnocylindria bacterium]|nr:DUF2723 domain-containing protein [Candidatus Limnocylindria bacterium]